MEDNVNNEMMFQIEEYKNLRKEIRFLEKSIGHYSLTGIVASVSILSGIGAIVFGKGNMCDDFYSYIFLFTPLICIILLFIIASHRNNIHKIGTYIQVFYEEKMFSYG